MTGQPKTISEDDRLKAFALAVMANDLYRQACKADMAMQKVLGLEFSFVGDAIYSDAPLTMADFDDALKRDEFIVS